MANRAQRREYYDQQQAQIAVLAEALKELLKVHYDTNVSYRSGYEREIAEKAEAALTPDVLEAAEPYTKLKERLESVIKAASLYAQKAHATEDWETCANEDCEALAEALTSQSKSPVAGANAEEKSD